MVSLTVMEKESHILIGHYSADLKKKNARLALAALTHWFKVSCVVDIVIVLCEVLLCVSSSLLSSSKVLYVPSMTGRGIRSTISFTHITNWSMCSASGPFSASSAPLIGPFVEALLLCCSTLWSSENLTILLCWVLPCVFSISSVLHILFWSRITLCLFSRDLFSSGIFSLLLVYVCIIIWLL